MNAHYEYWVQGVHTVFACSDVVCRCDDPGRAAQIAAEHNALQEVRSRLKWHSKGEAQFCLDAIRQALGDSP